MGVAMSDGGNDRLGSDLASANNGTARTNEERPLLRSFPNPSGYGTQSLSHKPLELSTIVKVQNYLTTDIATRWADLVLIACFFVSGSIDAGAYNAYENFASMQTGNTVFAALGVSNLPVGAPRLAWTKSVCSILCYLLGSVGTASFHRTFGQRKRWVMASSFALQTSFIIISAILVKRGSSSDSPRSRHDSSLATSPAGPGFPLADLIPIGLLSFQAAGKVVASRVLEYNAMPCVVLTTLYSDLVSDPGLFSAGLWSNMQRNQRAGGAVFYLLGAITGGATAGSDIGFSGGLWIAAVLHLIIVALWLSWWAAGEEHDVGV